MVLDHKVELLLHLRSLYYEGAPQNATLDLEMDYVAAVTGIPEKLVPGLLKDLLDTEFIEATTDMKHLAFTNGRCKISPKGLEYLHNWETMHQVPKILEIKKSAGFELPDLSR